MRLLFCASMTALGSALSAWGYQFGRPDGPLFYWGVLPGAPFILLALIGLYPGISLGVLIGAAVGSFLAVVPPYGLILYSSVNYSGGGANIGLGLLLLAIPVYLPFFMFIGGGGAWLIGSNKCDSMPRPLIAKDEKARDAE